MTDSAIDIDLSGALAAERIYVVFAGGGAKGLAHVTALRALERRGAIPMSPETQSGAVRGFAGTSAGAIMAALAAAGVRSDEMFNPDAAPFSPLLEALRKHDARLRRLTDIFDGGWPAIWVFRKILRGMGSLGSTGLAIGFVLFGVMSLVFLSVTVWSGELLGWQGSLWLSIVWVGLIATCGIVVSVVWRGLASLDRFSLALGSVLAERVGVAPASATFKSFDGRNRPLLRIISANISGRALALFSNSGTPDEDVGCAVAASACIPVIFAPRRINGEDHVDGGVVSNFPAWPFDRERALDEDCLTLGFSFAEKSRAGAGRSGGQPWPAAVVETALFGSAQLSTRAVGRAEFFTLRTELAVLDFDRPGADIARDLRIVEEAVQAHIDRRLIILPNTLRNTCAQIRNLAQSSLGAVCTEIGRIRCAVVMPTRHFEPMLLQTRHGVGNEDDPDRRLIMPLEDSLAGRAWETRLPVLHLLSPQAAWPEFTNPQHAALRRSLWRDLTWRLCLPIFKSDGEPWIVVTLDGSSRCNDASEVESMLGSIGSLIERRFQNLADEFGRVDDENP